MGALTFDKSNHLHDQDLERSQAVLCLGLHRSLQYAQVCIGGGNGVPTTFFGEGMRSHTFLHLISGS